MSSYATNILYVLICTIVTWCYCAAHEKTIAAVCGTIIGIFILSLPQLDCKKIKRIFLLSSPFLLWILISVFNNSGNYDLRLNIIENSKNTIPYIPKTIAANVTILNFCKLACLGILFCSFYATSKSSSTMFQNYLIRQALIVNTALITLIGIILRLYGIDLVGLIFPDEFERNPNINFSTFGYRGNYTAFCCMILPLCFEANKDTKNISSLGKIFKNFNTYCAFIILCGIICANSRIGWISLITMTLITVLSMNNGRSKNFISLICILTPVFIYVYNSNINPENSRKITPQGYWKKLDNTRKHKNLQIKFKVHLNNEKFIEHNNDTTVIKISNSSKKHFQRFLIHITFDKNNRLITYAKFNQSKQFAESVFIINSLRRIHDIEIEYDLEGGKENVMIDNVAAIPVHRRMLSNFTYHPSLLNELYLYGSVLHGNFNINIEGLKLYGDNSRLLYSHNNISNKIYGLLASFSESRARIYTNSIRLFISNCFVGVGLGCWPIAYNFEKNIDETAEYWAHCDWLQIICEIGILGLFTLIPYIFVIQKWIKRSYKILINNCRAELIGFTGLCIHTCLDFPMNVFGIQVLFILIIGVLTHKIRNLTNKKLAYS